MSGGYGQGGWPPPGGPPPGGSPGWPQQNIYAPPGSPGWTPNPGWPSGQGPQQQSAGTQAIVALVLAIASWVMCGCLTGLPAIFVARAELAAIERGESPVAGKSMAQAAFWVAVVNTVVYGVALLIYALIAFVFVASHAAGI